MDTTNLISLVLKICAIYGIDNFDKYYVCHTQDLGSSADTVAIFDNHKRFELYWTRGANVTNVLRM